MKECGFEQFEPTVVNEDNQATKRLSEDVVESTRTRHWDKEYHQIREEFERGTIQVIYCDTNLNAADVLTKGLSEPVHARHTNVLCGLEWNADEDPIYQNTLPEDRQSTWAREKSKLDLEQPGNISHPGKVPEKIEEEYQEAIAVVESDGPYPKGNREVHKVKSG